MFHSSVISSATLRPSICICAVVTYGWGSMAMGYPLDICMALSTSVASLLYSTVTSSPGTRPFCSKI